MHLQYFPQPVSVEQYALAEPALMKAKKIEPKKKSYLWVGIFSYYWPLVVFQPVFYLFLWLMLA